MTGKPLRLDACVDGMECIHRPRTQRIEESAAKLVARLKELAVFYEELGDEPDGAAIAWDLLAMAMRETESALAQPGPMPWEWEE